MEEPLIDLEYVNGEGEIGLSASIDQAIEKHLRLPIQLDEAKTMANSADYSTMAARAFHELVNREENINRWGVSQMNLIKCGALVVLSHGMLGVVRNPVEGPPPTKKSKAAVHSTAYEEEPDGDWEKAELPPLTAEIANNFKDGVTKELFHAVRPLVLACKIHYYQTNHHTGTEMGKFSGYPAKVFHANLAPKGFNEEDCVSVFHMISHWASTLHTIGVKPKWKNSPEFLKRVHKVGKGDFTFSDDAILRLSGMPAGHGKTGLAFAIASRLIRSPVFRFFPGKTALAELFRMYFQIRENPLHYHVGASYFSGHAVPRNEDIGNSTLGRLGTYLNFAFPNSTLRLSPAFMAKGSKVMDYKKYEDFEEMFEKVVIEAFKGRSGDVSESLKTRIIEANSFLPLGDDAIMEEVRIMFTQECSKKRSELDRALGIHIPEDDARADS